MHTTNYFNTLIEVSADCAAGTGVVPQRVGSVAALQYGFLSGAPYRFTSDALLAAVAATRRGLGEAEWPRVGAELFARPQACLRASPLVKSYGWGLHHDAEGRVALVARDSDEYQRLLADTALTKWRGMRSART